MFYLILAVLSSSAMGIVLKIFSEPKGNRYGIILGNYLTCILLSFLLLPDKGLVFQTARTTFLCGIVGGILFVAGLVLMQSSIRLSGVTLSSAFSKLGLLVSLAASIFLFGERPGVLQYAGIALVLIAVVLINSPGKKAGNDRMIPPPSSRALLFLFLILLANGCADTMAKVFEKVGAREQDGLYFFWLFITAAGITAFLALGEKKRTGKGILLTEMAAGILVGVPNYFSSSLLLKALVHLPAFLVYPAFSTGTILLVMAVSMALFRERLSRRQAAGVFLILFALILLNLR